MVTKTRIIKTDCVIPWWNLAVEEYLLDKVEKDECILYLWQNQNTVVIGKNQNAWRECRTELLEKEEGKLARRLSGGGAVFHDLGNLNFTFLMNRENYNLERQVKVILSAVNKVGIAAEMTGRNDLTVEGNKFSGNAFCFRKANAYHHGTILVSADIGKLACYLQVSEDKIKSKGIKSVQSRVANLTQYNSQLSIYQMAEAVIEAFKEEYGGVPFVEKNLENADKDVLQQLYEKYASWEWRYGEAPKFDIEINTRFSWGGIEIYLQLERGMIQKALVYSDAMDEEFIGMLPGMLEGLAFQSSVLADSICSMQADDIRRQMVNDITEWLKEKGF